MDIQKLQDAGVDKKYWEYCFITPGEDVFTPVTDDYGTVLQNGIDAYNEWERNKGAYVPEVMSYEEQFAALIMAQAKQKLAIDEVKRTGEQLMLEIDKLKGEKQNV